MLHKVHCGFRWYHDKHLDIRFIQQSSVYKNHIWSVIAECDFMIKSSRYEGKLMLIPQCNHEREYKSRSF